MVAAYKLKAYVTAGILAHKLSNYHPPANIATQARKVLSVADKATADQVCSFLDSAEWEELCVC